MSFWNYILLALIFPGLYFGYAVLFGPDQAVMAPVSLFLFMLAAFVVYSHLDSLFHRKASMAMAVPFWVILLVNLFPDFYWRLVWPYFFGIPLSAFMGYMAYKKNLVYLVLGVGLYALLGFVAIPNVLYLTGNNRMLSSPMPKVSFYDMDGDIFLFDSTKTYVLDFWHSRCPACFERFPEFETVAEAYYSDPTIAFHGVNVALEEEAVEVTRQKALDHRYTFDHIFVRDMDDAFEKLGIESYPRNLIIYKNQIYYNGLASTNPLVFNGYIHRILRDIRNN